MPTFSWPARFPQGITWLDYPGRYPGPRYGVEAERILGLESQNNIILAVTTTGNDNDATRPARIVQGDWSAKPFLTIQAAIQALPFRLWYGAASNTIATINVGPGTFFGFYVEGLVSSLGLRIKGTRQTSVPATGPSSGTATGGGVRTLTDATANWTPDDLVGRYLTITSGQGAGQILVIAANDATNIHFADPCSPTPAAGSAYLIEDLATVINGPTYRMAVDLGAPFGVYCLRNMGVVELDDLFIPANGGVAYYGTGNVKTVIRRCASYYYGFYEQDSLAISWSQLDAQGVTGIGLYNVLDVFNANRGWLVRNGSIGVDIQNCAGSVLYGLYARNCSYDALRMLACGMGGLTFYNFRAESCAHAVEAQTSVAGFKSSIINNCTVGPFNLFMARLYFEQQLSGTGNAGWGLYAKGSGNLIEITGFTPTIAAASGQVTVDGVNDVTWANLTNPGDAAVDAATGARVNRQ